MVKMCYESEEKEELQKAETRRGEVDEGKSGWYVRSEEAQNS